MHRLCTTHGPGRKSAAPIRVVWASLRWAGTPLRAAEAVHLMENCGAGGGHVRRHVGAYVGV